MYVAPAITAVGKIGELALVGQDSETAESN
jgi:hypothetical protein